MFIWIYGYSNICSDFAIKMADSVRTITTIAEFDKLIIDSATSKKPLFIKFSATWCPPCGRIAPTYKKLAEEHSSRALFAQADVDAAAELSAKYGIDQIPAFHCWGDSKFIASMADSSDPAKLESLVLRVLDGSKLNMVRVIR